MTAPINLDLDGISGELNIALDSIRRIKRWSHRVDVYTAEDDASRIMESAAMMFNISIRDMKSKARPNFIALPRQVAMLVIRERCPRLSLAQIGNMFGGRDHGTVLHACRAVTGQMTVDEKLARKVNRLRMMALNEFDGFQNGDGI